MFLGTLEELSGTFGLGRDGYFGTCDGYCGTLGTYPWDVRIMVGHLQFGTIEFWNMVRNGAILGRPPLVDWDNLVLEYGEEWGYFGTLPPPPVDRDNCCDIRPL